jgi:hypothetical protein
MNPDLCAVVKDEAQARHAAAPQGAQAAIHSEALSALSIETIQSVVKGLIGAGQKALTGTANDVIDQWRGGVLQWSTPEEWEWVAALATRFAKGAPAGSGSVIGQ